MHRYDICIDIPAGSRVDEDTLREVLPEWVDAADEAEAEAMIAAALARWAADHLESRLEHVTVYPRRVHVRDRAYTGYSYSPPSTDRPRILARRRVEGIATGSWLHLSDDDVLGHAPTGILAEWRWLSRTEGTWSWRPWAVESWDWVADAPAPEPPTDPDVRLEVWLALDPDEQWHHVVTLVDPASGDEMTTLSYHRHQPDAIARARRESVQLRLPLLVPEQEEHDHV